METYLREAADEPLLSTGAVLAVLAVVEGARVAHGHAVQADVELRLDAAAQAVAAAGELDGDGERKKQSFEIRFKGIRLALFARRATYNVDESREADDDDGEDAHQGAVHSGLDDPSGEALQGHWEELRAAKP